MSAPIIIPDAVDAATIEELTAVWPAIDSDVWHRYSGSMGEKLATLHWRLLPAEAWPVVSEIGWHMLSHYPGAKIDWRLHGAGLHEIRQGGSLPRHLDGERHPRTGLERWLSAVLFVDTLEPWHGGQLVIEDKATVRPQAGTLAIFETPGQWHEVLPVHAWRRRTVALFAYREAAGTGRTSALFQPRDV